jgi:predicted DNA-binding protein YlxM (UPF0122 family)
MLGEEGLSIKEAAKQLQIPCGALFDDIKRIRKLFAGRGHGSCVRAGGSV